VSGTRKRLNRDIIVEGALRVASRSDEHPGEAPTGASLGVEFSVDRSAIWRHFADKDDLLLAIADAMLAEVLEDLPAVEDADERLASVWFGMIAVFLKYPHVSARLGSHSVSGPHALRIIELIIGALSRLGVPPERLGLEYRAFIDLSLSYSAMLADYSLNPSAAMRREEVAMEIAIRNLDPEEFPRLTSSVEHLLDLPDGEIARAAFDSILVGLRNRYRSLHGLPRSS